MSEDERDPRIVSFNPSLCGRHHESEPGRVCVRPDGHPPLDEDAGDMRTQLAEVLGAHRLHASMNICTGCDWRATPNAGSLADQHEAHRADALAPLINRLVAEARAEGAASAMWVALQLRAALAARSDQGGADGR